MEMIHYKKQKTKVIKGKEVMGIYIDENTVVIEGIARYLGLEI